MPAFAAIIREHPEQTVMQVILIFKSTCDGGAGHLDSYDNESHSHLHLCHYPSPWLNGVIGMTTAVHAVPAFSMRVSAGSSDPEAAHPPAAIRPIGASRDLVTASGPPTEA